MNVPFNKPHMTGKETAYIQQAVAAGKISGNGEFTRVDAPEKLTLAVNDYLIADSRILRPLAFKPERNFRRLGRIERDVVADHLTGHATKPNNTTGKDQVK